jgi:hypothetical protein
VPWAKVGARHREQEILGFHQSSGKLDRRIQAGADAVREGDRIASARLTMRQCAGAFCIDPEQARAIFTNSTPRYGLRRRGEGSVKRCGGKLRP